MRNTAKALLVAATSIGAAVAARGVRARRRAYVDLYFADGSMISLADGHPESDRLVALARQVLAAAR